MSRRSIVSVFLALLLLLTQQIGATHAYSHWLGTQATAAQLTPDDDAAHRKLGDLHKICAHCIAIAQLSTVIHSPVLMIAGVPLMSTVVAGPVVRPSFEDSTYGFQPRAPPLA